MDILKPCPRGVTLVAVLASLHCPARGWHDGPPCPQPTLTLRVKDFGVTGNGTDESAPLNVALAEATRTGYPLELAPGATYYGKMLRVGPGLTIIGNGATIRMPPEQANWTRLVTTQFNLWDSDVDSPPLSIFNLTLDGNSENNQPFDRYEREQNKLLQLEANIRQPGRLTVLLESVRFVNSPSDGVTAFVNVHLKGSNISCLNAFRGCVTVTGGNTVIQLSNLSARGYGLHFEVANSGYGYGGTHRTDATITNSVIDGFINIGLRDHSVVTIDNLIHAGGGFSLAASDGSTILLRNGRIAVCNDTLYFPGRVTITGVEFVVPESCQPEEVSRRKWAVRVVWNTSYRRPTDQLLTFNFCHFRTERSSVSYPGAVEEFYGIYDTGGPLEDRNALVLNSVDVGEGFGYGLYMSLGSEVRWNAGFIDAAVAYHLRSSSVNVKARLQGLRFGEHVQTALSIPNGSSQNYVEHADVILDESSNKIEGRGLEQNAFVGGRLIIGSSPPSSITPGLVGDRFRLKVPLRGQAAEWTAVSSSAQGAAWTPTWVPIR